MKYLTWKYLSCGVPVLLALACAVPTGATTLAPNTINGFSDPGGFTLNGNPDDGFGGGAIPHGVPQIIGGTLHLTTTQGLPYTFTSMGTTYTSFIGDEATSAFFNNKQDITHFSASFVYHYNGTNPLSIGPADGFTFVLQNAFLGTTSLGNSGSDLGYGGPQAGSQGSRQGAITPSVALEFNIFGGHPIGVALEADGITAAEQGDHLYHSAAPVDLLSGDPILVSVIYDGVNLVETLTDQTTGQTHQDSYKIDIPQIVNPGGLNGFVGFTGGTGSGVSDQTITGFVFGNGVPNNYHKPPTGPNLTLTYKNQSQSGLTAVITNSGTEVDNFQIKTATLNGIATSTSLPTTPNIIGLGGTQSTPLAFSLPAGTHTGSLRVQGVYIDHVTGLQGTFIGSVRNIAIP